MLQLLSETRQYSAFLRAVAPFLVPRARTSACSNSRGSRSHGPRAGIYPDQDMVWRHVRPSASVGMSEDLNFVLSVQTLPRNSSAMIYDWGGLRHLVS